MAFVDKKKGAPPKLWGSRRVSVDEEVPSGREMIERVEELLEYVAGSFMKWGDGISMLASVPRMPYVLMCRDCTSKGTGRNAWMVYRTRSWLNLELAYQKG